ncbi:MAG: phosphomannomutase [Pseudomonadota bacterium]|nr:phosphomannomutase [Pseudomonadota bacterium]
MRIGDLMVESGVMFGTSGARGMAEDMTDLVCYAYTLGFLQHLSRGGDLAAGGDVGIAGDFRPSTGRIMGACARAVADLGFKPRNFGRIPSPALAAFGIDRHMPSMMVTGSHIPDDRNGIKFNLPTGEILKEDEEGIRGQDVSLPAGLFDTVGSFPIDTESVLPVEETTAFDAYVARYLNFFPADCLAGVRIGLYEHSSVARDAYHAVLIGLGARVDRLGFSETFIPVDTEAIRPEDVELADGWGATGEFDALVSADGDGDRPLVSDERGEWLRGDIAGILCAKSLGAEGVVTPVSSNTAVEKCGWFAKVMRTRIGSPFVIAGMHELVERGLAPVVGYEANGGFLLASDIERDGRRLPALPTRDAVLVAVSVLLSAKAQGKPVSRLAADLPKRYTYSDRIKNFPTELSQARLAALSTGDFAHDKVALEDIFEDQFGEVAGLDTTDGLRITFGSGEIAHLRPSGNAPELRAYTEAASPERAQAMNRICMGILSSWRE